MSNKTRNFLLVVLIFITAFVTCKGAATPPETPAIEPPMEPTMDDATYVDITIKALTDSFSAGAKGEVSVALIPRSGVTLNKLPPLHIIIESPENVKFDKNEIELPEKKEREKLEEVFYEKIMDPSADMTTFYFPKLEPFKFPFTLQKDSSMDLHLKVKIAYT